MRKLRYKTIRKRIVTKLQTLSPQTSDAQIKRDYRTLRKLYKYMLNYEVRSRIKREHPEQTAVRDALPVLKRIYNDPDTPLLFLGKMKNSRLSITSTESFLKFIEILVK